MFQELQTSSEATGLALLNCKLFFFQRNPQQPQPVTEGVNSAQTLLYMYSKAYSIAVEHST